MVNGWYNSTVGQPYTPCLFKPWSVFTLIKSEKQSSIFIYIFPIVPELYEITRGSYDVYSWFSDTSKVPPFMAPHYLFSFMMFYVSSSPTHIAKKRITKGLLAQYIHINHWRFPKLAGSSMKSTIQR